MVLPEHVTAPYRYSRHFQTAVTLEEWALLYEDIVDKRQPVWLYLHGQPQRVMITDVHQPPEGCEDQNVYLTGYHMSPSLEP